MGTQTGAKVMNRRYGFVHEPQPTQPNRWIADPHALLASTPFIQKFAAVMPPIPAN